MQLKHYILVNRLLLFDLHSPDASWYWGTYACDDACVVVNEQYGLLRLHMKRTEYRAYDGGVFEWACVVAYAKRGISLVMLKSDCTYVCDDARIVVNE